MLTIAMHTFDGNWKLKHSDDLPGWQLNVGWQHLSTPSITCDTCQLGQLAQAS